VNVFEMSAQIATLCESFMAFWTAEGSQACVLPEMVAQVAALLECAGTSRELALEEELDTLSMRVFNFDSLVPLGWNTFKMLHFKVLLRFDPIIVILHVFILV
jgi:hypothetical protein